MTLRRHKLALRRQKLDGAFAALGEKPLFWGMKRIRLTDGSVNKYGFRVLTSGLDMDEFRKNPVMFFGHDEWGLPIGRWEQIESDGEQVTAVPVFDETDSFALKVKSKWEQGMLNAASIGISMLALSEEKAHMLPGQTRPTVTRSRLREASIVNVPANASAYKLYHDGKPVRLGEGMGGEELDAMLPKIKTHDRPMKEITLRLGLAENATEEEILAALDAAKAKPAEAKPAEAKPAATAAPAADPAAAAIEAVAALAESKGLKADMIRALAKSDLDAALAFVKEYQAPAPAAAPKPAATAAEILKLAQTQGKPAEGREKWGYGEWSKKDPKGLAQMKRERPEQHKALSDAHTAAAKAANPQWF